jgi:hypothetical protein
MFGIIIGKGNITHSVLNPYNLCHYPELAVKKSD